MNKEIEEMALEIPEKIKDPLDNSRYIIFGKSLRREIARIYYNAGYRKIDDNCAVITKAELELYQRQAVKEFSNILYKAIFKKPIIETGEKCIVPINGLIDSITFNNLLEKFLNEEDEITKNETDRSKKEI